MRQPVTNLREACVLSSALDKAHSRRKFDELYTKHRSELAAETLGLFGKLYKVEREAREQNLDAIGRARRREDRARPIADVLHEWLVVHRPKVPDGSASAKAINYSLKRWKALIRYIDDGNLPIDNNWMENRIRPVAQGRRVWLFANNPLGARASANLFSLVSTARANGLDASAYLTYLFERLPAADTLEALEVLLPWNVRDVLRTARRAV